MTEEVNHNQINSDSIVEEDLSTVSNDKKLIDTNANDSFSAKSEIKLLMPPAVVVEPWFEKKYITVPMALIIIGFAAFMVGYGTLSEKVSKQLGADVEKEKIDYFSNLQLEARAVYVYDMKNESVIYALNENDVLPLASLTKLMAAVITKESLPSDTVITIQENDILAEGDTGLRARERWKLSDLLSFTLLTSSNDGASALVAAAGSLGQNLYIGSHDNARLNFVTLMNNKAEELGLRGSRFFNGTGLDVDGEISGGYGTARDIAHLMGYSIRTLYDEISITSQPFTSFTSLSKVFHIANNTNDHLAEIPGLIASKTGYTELAGGNLIVIFDAGLMHPIIISVLGSTRDGRFTDVEKLTWATLQSI